MPARLSGVVEVDLLAAVASLFQAGVVRLAAGATLPWVVAQEAAASLFLFQAGVVRLAAGAMLPWVVPEEAAASLFRAEVVLRAAAATLL